ERTRRGPAPPRRQRGRRCAGRAVRDGHHRRHGHLHGVRQPGSDGRDPRVRRRSRGRPALPRVRQRPDALGHEPPHDLARDVGPAQHRDHGRAM
ncbi:MAG: hypothetical protein AVDCRST_MAG06-2559, partial [uncultured Nocardioides sp.]